MSEGRFVSSFSRMDPQCNHTNTENSRGLHRTIGCKGGSSRESSEGRVGSPNSRSLLKCENLRIEGWLMLAAGLCFLNKSDVSSISYQGANANVAA